MMKYSMVLCFLVLGSSSSPSQIHFPLQVGNRWYYQWHFRAYEDTLVLQIGITGDTILPNGKTYAIRELLPTSTGQEYIRAEDQKLFLYNQVGDSDCVIYDFSLSPGDSTCRNRLYYEQIDTLFGRHLRGFTFMRLRTYGVGEEVADSLGIIFYLYDLGAYRQLIGAVIDGVTYGTIDKVEEPRWQAPTGFTLLQNYPNPFNPSTSISFSLSRREWVNLSIYDLVGRLIAVIVNETRPAGSYVEDWKPESFSSGIYVCRLRTSSSSITHKIAYIK